MNQVQGVARQHADRVTPVDKEGRFRRRLNVDRVAACQGVDLDMDNIAVIHIQETANRDRIAARGRVVDVDRVGVFGRLDVELITAAIAVDGEAADRAGDVTEFNVGPTGVGEARRSALSVLGRPARIGLNRGGVVPGRSDGEGVGAAVPYHQGAAVDVQVGRLERRFNVTVPTVASNRGVGGRGGQGDVGQDSPLPSPPWRRGG